MYYNTLSILYFRDCLLCVAIQILYCRLLAGKTVSRYKICIVTEWLSWLELGCNTKYCIVARQLGRLGAQASGGRAGARHWGEARARGALRHGRSACDTAGWRPRHGR